MKIYRGNQVLSGYIIDEPFAALPVVTHCGEAICERGHHLSTHTHSGFEFLMLTRGQASWVVDGREYAQKIGDVFVVFPHQPHRTGQEHNSENEHLWIGVDLARFSAAGKRLARELQRQKGHIFPGGTDLEPLLRGLIAQAIRHRPQATAIARHYLNTIVAILLQRVEQPESSYSLPFTPRSLPIQRTLAYMEQNINCRLSLKDLARVAAIRSAAHFCTRFHKEIGIAPGAMHLRLRLKAAKEILTQSMAENITDVAMHLGFSSTQHFSGKFKQAFGITPSNWRTMSRFSEAIGRRTSSTKNLTKKCR